MQRVIIIGCSGAGKSTLATRLGQIVDLPVVHIDKLFWLPGWVERERAEFDKLVEQAAAAERWIIDGNYSRTMPQRIARADTIIWLDFPRWVCLYRVLKRRVTYHRQKRPDIDCTEKIDWEFIKWVWTYPNRSRPNTIARLALAGDDKRIIVFKRPAEMERWLSEIRSGKQLTRFN